MSAMLCDGVIEKHMYLYVNDVKHVCLAKV